MAVLNRSIFKATAIVSAILLVAYIALLLTVNSTKFQKWIRAEIAERTGYDVSARDIRLDPLLRLTLTDMKAVKAERLTLRAQRVVVVPSFISVFSRSIHRLELENPVLSFDLYEFFNSTKESASGVSIRHLIIHDGTFVLKMGEGSEVDFRSVALRADNVNLGQGVGVRLRTAVPWLNGVAVITVEGRGNEKEATIRLEQSEGRGLAELIQGKNRETFDTKIKLKRIDGGSIRISAQGKLDGMRIAEESVSGDVSASAEIKPDLKEALFAVTANATELPAKLPLLPVPIPEGKATLTLHGNYDLAAKNLHFESLELRSPLGDATGQGQVSFAAAAAWKNARLRVRKVAVESLKPMLPSPMNTMIFEGAAEADLQISGPWRAPVVEGVAHASGVKLRHEQFSLAELNLETPVQWSSHLFRAGDIRLSGRKLLLGRHRHMEISAEVIRFAGMLERKQDEAVQVSGAMQIEQGAFASADGSKLGEKLSLDARFDSIRFGDGVSLAGNVRVDQGEVLWNKFYGDLRSHRAALEFDAEYRRNGDLLRLRRANLVLASVGQFALYGEFADISKSPIAQIKIKSDAVQSAGIFEFFIRENLNRSYPVLDRLAVAGLIGLSAEASGPVNEPSIAGTVTLRGGELRAKTNDWRVSGIDIALPFRVGYPAAPPKTAPGNPATGTLTIGSAKFGSEVISGIKFTVSLWDNVLRFHQPIRLPIYGGSLVISGLAWKDVVEAPRAVSLSLEATNLQLRKLTEALDWYRFEGTLSGSIPKIEWTGGSLRSDGQIDIAVFDGRLRVSQLEIEAPFSSVPSVKLDASFQGIQLEQASETFAFGRISGVLAGTVSDLVVTAGQPSSFTADIHSVEESGVSQRISVESLNKITVLSSGQDAGALYGGIAGFFDSFRYSKLGFKATLKNDKLKLRGVESRDEQEYLVVGSFIPPTVNVISHTQEIAFLELLRRLERIQKADTPQKTSG